MNLKLSKILASALVTGLMAISGHAVAGNAVESISVTPSAIDLQCAELRAEYISALGMRNIVAAMFVASQLKELDCKNH